MIILVVLFLIAAGLWYATQSALTIAEKDSAAAASTRDKAMEEVTTLRKDQVEMSKLVGFTDTTTVNALTDASALQAELAAVKTELGAAGNESLNTLAAAITALRSANKASQEQYAAAKADLDKELAARQAAEGNVNSVETTYKEQVGKLTQELQDVNQRADNQSKTDSQRFDELLAAQSSADAAAKQSQQALAELQVQAKREASTKDATIKALALRREPSAPEGVDGHVLSVGSAGSMAYIDLGSRDGVKRGTRFEVLRPGKGSEFEPLGTVEVRDVENDMALVGLVGKSDAFNPILPGDALRNPHFEKGRVLHYFLLGQFPLTLSREFVTSRLKDLGAEVDEKLGTETDVVVLGEKDLGEGDAAKDLTETDEYKLADRLGMRIIRLNDLAEYLRS